MKFRSIYFSIIFFAGLFLMSCGATQNTQGNNGLLQLKKNWDNYERSYFIHIPSQEMRNQSLPILFVLHGGGGNAKQIATATQNGFNLLANQEGFIVVYPQGYEKNWNDGRNLDLEPAWVKKMDDVGFLSSIVDDLISTYNINTEKVFTTGISNGGFMSSRLLCDRADLFRGGAILTATISEDYLPACQPSQPTAVLVMNGTDDPIVPYHGGDIKLFRKTRGKVISTDDYINFWKTSNNCTSTLHLIETIDQLDDGTSVDVLKYSNCTNRGSVVLYKINGGGHTWPGATSLLGGKIVGKTSKEINACQVIWDYFKSLD